MSYLVSIIVPIYNAEKYIDRCITSIQNQTYTKIQIILVNDGSADGSYDICKKYAENDNRIVLINQNNKGVVETRKVGIQAAGGDCVAWVDADDWIEEDYIERMVMLMCDTGVDMVAVAHYHDIGFESTLVKNGISPGIYKTKEIIYKMLYSGTFYEYGIGPHLVTKLFKTDILKKISSQIDNKIIAGDDATMVYSGILEINKICVSDMAGYHYIQNPTSITKINYGDEKNRVDCLIDFLEKRFKDKNVYDETANQLKIYWNYMMALRDISFFDYGDKSILAPYGGFEKNDKIVIYGAGVLGQKIYKHLRNLNINIIAWLDRNWENYRANGYDVISPDELSNLDGTYDYILIANINEKVATSIKTCLLETNVKTDKIRWFTDEFCGKTY